MTKIFKWFLLLTKRLFKKKSFIFLVVLIPLSVFLISISAAEKSGFLNIALTFSEKPDIDTYKICEEIVDSSELINFEIISNRQDAVSLLKSGKIDAVWIFPNNMEEKINLFVKNKTNSSAVVHIIEREENVALNLSHEKLTGALYKNCSKAQYINFVRTKAKQLDNLSDEELLKYYNEYEMIGDLFSIHTPYSNTQQQGTNYLLAPIRGILAILIVLGAIAACLYYLKDETNGTYALIPLKFKPLIAFANQIITCLVLSVVVLVSIYISKISVNPIKEIAVMLLYILSASAFSSLFLNIFKNIKTFAALAPVLIISMSILCPVFIDIKLNYVLPLIFPPTYYLNGLYNNNYILYMVIYTAVCLILSLLINTIRNKKSSAV